MLCLALALLLVVAPMKEFEDRLAALEAQGAALRAQVGALSTEMVRGRRNMRDGMSPSDVAALLSPRNIGQPIGSRSGTDRTPDLATPLLARLRDDASLPGLSSGRVDTFDGYANVLSDPTFDTLAAKPLGSFATIGTGYTAIGPYWEAKYVLNSGTVATTRSMGQFSPRGDAAGYGYGVGSSAIGELIFVFGTDASDMTIYLRPTATYLWEQPLPSWLVSSMRIWLLDIGGASTPNVPATAYLEIVDSTDTVVASGDTEDLMNLMDLNEFGALDAAFETPTVSTGYRPRLRIDLVKTAGATGQTYILLAETLFAGSNDGSAPAYTPAVGSWLPGAPGRQLVKRTFVANNLVNSTTVTLDVSATGYANQVPEAWGGSIVGVAYRWTADITAGAHSVDIRKNGSTVWGAFSGASAREDAVTQPPWINRFNALDDLTIDVTTNVAFAPSGSNDIVVELYLLLDYDSA